MLPRKLFVCCLLFSLSEVFAELKSSLTFVIDDTASMSNEIDQVKQHTYNIFDAVLKSNESQIEDFVLVTFNDPTTLLRVVTRDRDEYKNAVSSISVDGGGNCPEYSMSGIIKAIENSRPGSTIYVFTDASSSDMTRYIEAKNLAIKKQIQVVFALTGICSTRSSPDYLVYTSLAKDTQGEVFHLDRSEIKDFLSYVEENIKARRTILAEAHFPPGSHSLNFTITSNTVGGPLLSVKGTNPTVKVSGPDGALTETKPIFGSSESVISKIANPARGVHTVHVHSKSGTHVLISARTRVKFQHGFSTFRPTSISDTTTGPLPDVKSHIAIKLTDGEIDLKNVKVILMNDTLVKELPLAVLDVQGKLFLTELEDFPDTIFRIAITGINPSNGEVITVAGSPIASQPKLAATNRAPRVSISGSVNGTLNVKGMTPVQLSCKINGYPQPDVVWTNRDSGEALPAKVFAVELPDNFTSILDIDRVVGTTNYECRATNRLGTFSTTTTVQAMTYFNVIRAPADTAKKYLERAEIHCEVEAYPPVRVSWYKNRKTLSKNDNIEISGDKSTITIKRMNPADDGFYICEVRSKIRRKVFKAEVTTTGLARPKIDKTVKTVDAQSGSDVVLSCNIIDGNPKPMITWSRGNSAEEQPLPKWENTTSITLHNVTANDSGIYDCLAENVFSNDYHAVKLNVEYPPIIKEDVEEVMVAEGKPFYLPCSVAGSPAPTVTWYKDSSPVGSSDKIYIRDSSTSYKDKRIKIQANFEDSGLYTCNATNRLGTARRVVRVDVIEPVTIDVPKDTKLNVKAGDTLDLPCQARGFPIPETAWTYFNFDSSVPPKSLLKSRSSSALRLNSMQLGEGGYYTCEARNAWGQNNFTYEIHVLASPIFEKVYTDNKLKAVEGDLGLTLKCKVSGNPPPKVSWLKNGYSVTTGVTVEDGFMLNNIRKEDAGRYECVARNSVGVDSIFFEVSVAESPEASRATSTVNIGEGASSAVPCNVPHRGTDLLRWYKNNVLIHAGELEIRNAKSSDSGLYTCRVSGVSESTSAGTMVIVGVKPTFDGGDELNIEFAEGTPYVMSCDANGDPKPTYTWWHGGEQLNATESYHSFEMELGTQGEYICEARNTFGSIVRKFNVFSRDCVINIMQHSRLQPLMLSSKLEWPQHAATNGYMSIPKKQSIVLFCPNRFQMFPGQYEHAFCEGGTSFMIRGNPYDYKHIKCTQKVKHFIENTNEKCLSGNTELMKVVFEVPLNAATVDAYEVCLDKDSKLPLYTKMRLRPSAANVEFYEPEWSHDGIDLILSDAYDCNRQNNMISTMLSQWFHREDGCCFGQRQLVSPRDLPPGAAQRAAYSKLNVVPHWSTCNLHLNNWNEVEQRVRNLVKASESELLVATGVAEVLHLPDSTNNSQEIFIMDRKNQRQYVPTYLWKLVQEPSSKSSLVIIQVNVPDLLPESALAHIRCRDICNATEWMKGSTWHDVTKGFTYCCTLEHFENSFGYKGVFEPLYKVMNDVSLMPDGSLTR